MQRLTILFAAALMSSTACLPALAQSAGDAPEQVREWYPIVAAMLFAILVGIGSFKSGKRGHQD